MAAGGTDRPVLLAYLLWVVVGDEDEAGRHQVVAQDDLGRPHTPGEEAHVRHVGLRTEGSGDSRSKDTTIPYLNEWHHGGGVAGFEKERR